MQCNAISSAVLVLAYPSIPARIARRALGYQVPSYLAYPGDPGPVTVRNFEMSVTPITYVLMGGKAIDMV